MQKDYIGFRISPDIKKMLDEMIRQEEEKALKYDISPKTKTDIICEAIENYYLTRVINQNYTPLMRTVEEAIRTVFRENMKPLVECINAVRYDIRESLEYQRLQCKAMNLDLAEGGIEALLYSVMPWDIAIPQKIAREMQAKQPIAAESDNK